MYLSIVFILRTVKVSKIGYVADLKKAVALMAGVLIHYGLSKPILVFGSCHCTPSLDTFFITLTGGNGESGRG